MPMPRIDPDVFYDEVEAAALLRISVPTLRRRRRETSTLPFCRFGRRIWYRGRTLVAALEATERASTSDALSPNVGDRRQNGGREDRAGRFTSS